MGTPSVCASLAASSAAALPRGANYADNMIFVNQFFYRIPGCDGITFGVFYEELYGAVTLRVEYT